MGRKDGTMTGGPVGGEVGFPDGSEIPAPAGLRRLQGEMNAPLIESQWGLRVGVLYNRQATGKKDEHGTHVNVVLATAVTASRSSALVGGMSAPECNVGSGWRVGEM